MLMMLVVHARELFGSDDKLRIGGKVVQYHCM
jgi:hypothetical protein